MPLTAEQIALVEGFRTWIERAVTNLGLFGEVSRHDRDDHSTLATRWTWDRDIWLEIAVRPFLPQVRVGLVTVDRWKSDDFEQMIENSGDTLQEFVQLGFKTAGLDWHDPPVEHYCHKNSLFHFATPLDLRALEQLTDDEIRAKVCKMVTGYHRAFSGTATG
jgi:hypothetical protein